EPFLLLPAAPLERHLLLLEREGGHERLAALARDRGRQRGVLDVLAGEGILTDRHHELRELIALGARGGARLLAVRGVGGRRRAPGERHRVAERDLVVAPKHGRQGGEGDRSGMGGGPEHLEGTLHEGAVLVYQRPLLAAHARVTEGIEGGATKPPHGPEGAE